MKTVKQREQYFCSYISSNKQTKTISPVCGVGVGPVGTVGVVTVTVIGVGVGRVTLVGVGTVGTVVPVGVGTEVPGTVGVGTMRMKNRFCLYVNLFKTLSK